MLGFLSNNAATIEVYTLSLHDALPISSIWQKLPLLPGVWGKLLIKSLDPATTRKLKAPKRFEPSESDIRATIVRSEEHTSELQSRRDLVCRLLLEKKNIEMNQTITISR